MLAWTCIAAAPVGLWWAWMSSPVAQISTVDHKQQPANRADSISRMQQALRAFGLWEGPATAQWDEQTKRAVATLETLVGIRIKEDPDIARLALAHYAVPMANANRRHAKLFLVPDHAPPVLLAMLDPVAMRRYASAIQQALSYDAPVSETLNTRTSVTIRFLDEAASSSCRVLTAEFSTELYATTLSTRLCWDRLAARWAF
jgi:hypothetical protein